MMKRQHKNFRFIGSMMSPASCRQSFLSTSYSTPTYQQSTASALHSSRRFPSGNSRTSSATDNHRDLHSRQENRWVQSQTKSCWLLIIFFYEYAIFNEGCSNTQSNPNYIRMFLNLPYVYVLFSKEVSFTSKITKFITICLSLFCSIILFILDPSVL